MDHMTSRVNLHKKIMKIFPWVEVINQEFTKSFSSDYEAQSLKSLNTKIQKELRNVSFYSNRRRVRYLFEVIGYFYNHFCWKIKWNKHCPHMKAACVQLLADLIKVALMLSRGNVESLWLNRILAAIKMFPGSSDLLYDSLLGVSSLKRKYQNAYGVILKHVLFSSREEVEDPIEYLKVIFLFRRLKFLLKDPKENAGIAPTVSKLKPPCTVKSWLLAHNFEMFWNVNIKTIGRKLMRKSLDKDILLRLREILFSGMSLKDVSPSPKFPKVDGPRDSGLFVIDTTGQADTESEMVKSNCSDSLEEVPYSSQPIRKRKLKTVMQENSITNSGSEEFKQSVRVKKKKQKLKTSIRLANDTQTKNKPILGDVIGEKTKVNSSVDAKSEEQIAECLPCIKVTSRKKRKRRVRKANKSIGVEEGIQSVSNTALLSCNSEDVECIAISSSSDTEDIPDIIAEVHPIELISNRNNVSVSEAYSSKSHPVSNKKSTLREKKKSKSIQFNPNISLHRMPIKDRPDCTIVAEVLSPDNEQNLVDDVSFLGYALNDNSKELEEKKSYKEKEHNSAKNNVTEYEVVHAINSESNPCPEKVYADQVGAAGTNEFDANPCETSLSTDVGGKKMKLPLLSNKTHLQQEEKLAEEPTLNSSGRCICDEEIQNEIMENSQPVELNNQSSDLEETKGTEIGSSVEEENVSFSTFNIPEMNDTKISILSKSLNNPVKGTFCDFKSTEVKTEAVLQEQSHEQMEDSEADPTSVLNPDTASKSDVLMETSNCFSSADVSELEKSSAEISCKETSVIEDGFASVALQGKDKAHLSNNKSIVFDNASDEIKNCDAFEMVVKKTENVDMGILESVGLRKRISVQIPAKSNTEAPERNIMPNTINEPSEDGASEPETNLSVTFIVEENTACELNEPSVVVSFHAASEDASANEGGILTEQKEKKSMEVETAAACMSANESQNEAIESCTFGDSKTVEPDFESELGITSSDKVLEESTKLQPNQEDSKVESLSKTAVSYLMEKMLQRVEMADHVDMDSSFETLKHNIFKDDIKFTPDTHRSSKVTGFISSLESTHKVGRAGNYLSFLDVSLRSDNDVSGNKSLKDSTGSSEFSFYRELFSDLNDNGSEEAMSESKIDESECSDIGNCSDSEESESDLTTSLCHSPSMSTSHSDKTVSSKCDLETVVKSEPSTESNPESTEADEANDWIDSQNLQIGVSKTDTPSSAESSSSFRGDSILNSEELAVKEHMLPVVYLGKKCDTQDFAEKVLKASSDAATDDAQASDSENMDGKRNETGSNTKNSPITKNSSPIHSNIAAAITENPIPSNSRGGDSDAQKEIFEDLQTNTVHVMLTDIFGEKDKLEQEDVKPIMPLPPTRNFLESSQETEQKDAINMESVDPTDLCSDELKKEVPLGDRKLRSQTVKTSTNEKPVPDASDELDFKPSITIYHMSLRDRNSSVSSHRTLRKSMQITPASVNSNARRSSKRLKREVNLNLGLHFSELSLHSPKPRHSRLHDPSDSHMPEDVANNESGVNTNKELPKKDERERRMTTRSSTVLKIDDSTTLSSQESDPEGYNLRSRKSVIMPGNFKL